MSSVNHVTDADNVVVEGSSSSATNGVSHHTGNHNVSFPPSQSTGLLDSNTMQVAATLVLDAKYGRNLTFKKDPDSVKNYIMFHHFLMRWTLYLLILVILALAIFERPAVVTTPYWATMLVEGLCLGFFLFRALHASRFQTNKDYFGDKKNIVILVIIVLTFIDMICYVVWTSVTPENAKPHPFRWSRPLRPLFIVNFGEGKEIRRAFRNIRRTVPGIIYVLILFFFSVAVYALLGMQLFRKRSYKYPNGQPYFSTYFDAVWDLYVLVTTANDPDVMMPAYNKNNWYALYFMSYLVITLYIFMSILLAVIYNNYRKHLKNEVKAAVYMKRRKLAEAFECLKCVQDGKDIITEERWFELMKFVLPGRRQEEMEILLCVIDESGDGYIVKKDFLNVADLLNVELSEVHERRTLIEHYLPNLYFSAGSEIVKMVVKHKFFRYFFDLMIVVNAFFIGFDVQEAEWFFLVLFSLEIILKMYTFGLWRFFSALWNVFDFLVIGAALVASIVEACIGESEDISPTLDFLLVLRVLRVVKIISGLNRFKVIIQTIVNIGPSILTYGGVLFVLYYTFAIIGMEAFQGLIRYYNETEVTADPKKMYCGNKALMNSTFYKDGYCANNFNDIFKSIVILFELMVVNQWHVLAEGFVLVTHSAAKIYFFAFHIGCVIIILNIFTAFILEAFILEYSLSKNKLETVVEAKIRELGYGLGQRPTKRRGQSDEPGLVDNIELQESSLERSDSNESLPDLQQEQGLRFHLQRQRSKKVDILLQQMFEGEIDPEDLGPEVFDPDDMDEPIPRKLTLDQVT